MNEEKLVSIAVLKARGDSGGDSETTRAAQCAALVTMNMAGCAYQLAQVMM